MIALAKILPQMCQYCDGRGIYEGKDVATGQCVELACLYCDETGLARSSNCAFDDDECVEDMLGGPSALSDFMWRHGPGFVVGCYFTVGAAWVWSWFL